MKQILLTIMLAVFSISLFAQTKKEEVAKVMDSWHQAAAKADFKAYFDLMDEESIFIGTDATERWDKPAFMAYAKPHFDKGKAWNFTPLERHINFSKNGKTAWLDELLDTQMKICRGSAVLELKNGKWSIKHYVLSMTVPNDVSHVVIKTKAAIEDKVIQSIKHK
ncbi:nuclear transport factor 2 family protein [Sphingobacterium hotanense]|uniref:Nuclear transport factor 2 family protein n=1 Tax=Sphingobacterium hotanense TaxID=649196 RepID=A0ABT7NJ70_9SPHI|nr:nuclear transport factor 2 family protein [Sphingobacterium hotanense]MDM1047235.1 nuclear transport factor 2 family protein [Sphingobacterium hotanense]